VDITINSPVDGERLKVFAEKFDYIAVINTTLIGNQTYGDSDYMTRCHYFDENKVKWDTSGITELEISGPNGRYLINHFSSFIILRVPQQLNTDYSLVIIKNNFTFECN